MKSMLTKDKPFESIKMRFPESPRPPMNFKQYETLGAEDMLSKCIASRYGYSIHGTQLPHGEWHIVEEFLLRQFLWLKMGLLSIQPEDII